VVELKTVPNELRCAFTEEEHSLNVSDCCPVSHNPLPGSIIYIRYKPQRFILEVSALRNYVDSYRGGLGEVRSMEGMIQSIAQDVADTLWVDVTIEARLLISPEQRMNLKCYAFPKSGR
jgi:NADPH-dependent 7-cyano-7-deazaguanine reductase QueF